MSTDDDKDNVLTFPGRPPDCRHPPLPDVKSLVAKVRGRHDAMDNAPASGDHIGVLLQLRPGVEVECAVCGQTIVRRRLCKVCAAKQTRIEEMNAT